MSPKYRNMLLSLATASLVTTIVPSAHAIPTDIYVFGDSWSDSEGNGFCSPSGYNACKWSNGDLWVEDLAGRLGLGMSSGYLSGNNYAVAGAQTLSISSSQVTSYQGNSGGVADADGLYVVSGGINDFYYGVNPVTAAANIVYSVTNLASMGADHILVTNLPDLSLLPYWAGNSAASAFTNAFNDALTLGLMGLGVLELDVFQLFNGMTTNPGAFDFTNVTTGCYYVGCGDPDRFLFWDSLHITAATNRFIGQSAFTAVQGSMGPTSNTTVPEPQIPVLLILAFAVLTWSRGRVSQQSVIHTHVLITGHHPISSTDAYVQ